MAKDGQRKRPQPYRIDEAFGYKPEKDPPRTPPTWAKSKGERKDSASSDGEPENRKTSER